MLLTIKQQGRRLHSQIKYDKLWEILLPDTSWKRCFKFSFYDLVMASWISVLLHDQVAVLNSNKSLQVSSFNRRCKPEMKLKPAFSQCSNNEIKILNSRLQVSKKSARRVLLVLLHLSLSSLVPSWQARCHLRHSLCALCPSSLYSFRYVSAGMACMSWAWPWDTYRFPQLYCRLWVKAPHDALADSRNACWYSYLTAPYVLCLKFKTDELMAQI